jgi:hypothetical protein
MNLEDYPAGIKEDIEDQSLEILGGISEDIIVIGGWAVRALLQSRHARYTLDVDGITKTRKIEVVGKKLETFGLKGRRAEWGVQYFKKYNPGIKIPVSAGSVREDIELRIEISGPRIKEKHTHHFFEFDLNEYEKGSIPFHSGNGSVQVKIPPARVMAAVKLGLPADYKNNFDAAALLGIADIGEVIRTIKSNDDWRDVMVRRIPKLIGRISMSDDLAHILAVNAGIDIRGYARKLKEIEKQLKL